jgi:ABC-2 type transport system ATP-binding protein
MQSTVEEILREVAAEGRTVFFSSHILEEVESLCTRAAVVRDGRVVSVFDLAEQRRLAPTVVEVAFAAPPPSGAFSALPPTITLLRSDGAHAAFEVRDGFDALVKALAACTVEHVLSRQPTLEELFVRYYTREGGA